MTIVKLSQWFSLFFFAYTLIFNYSYFFVPALFLIFLNNSKFDLSENQLKILTLFPFIFYSTRYISGLSEKYNFLWKSLSHPNYYLGARYLDLQQALLSLKCNFDPIKNFTFKFSTLSTSCPWSAKYGPLLEIVPYFGNIWRDTLIISFFTISISLVFFKIVTDQFPKYRLIFTIIFLSPSINFLFERMNIDIFIMIISTYIIYNYKNKPIFYSFILLTMALIKLHPIGFILGLITYSVAFKNNKLLVINISTGFLFVVLYAVSAFIQNKTLSTEWRPDDPLLTFGILSDANFLSKEFSSSILFFYTFIIFILFIFQLVFFKKNFIRLTISEDRHKIMFHSFTLFLATNILYANFDYRIPIFYPLVLLLMFNTPKNKYFFIYAFLFLKPFGFIAEFLPPDLKLYLTLTFSFLGKVSLYGFFLIAFKNIYYDLLERFDFYR